MLVLYDKEIDGKEIAQATSSQVPWCIYKIMNIAQCTNRFCFCLGKLLQKTVSAYSHRIRHCLSKCTLQGLCYSLIIPLFVISLSCKYASRLKSQNKSSGDSQHVVFHLQLTIYTEDAFWDVCSEWVRQLTDKSTYNVFECVSGLYRFILMQVTVWTDKGRRH